MELWPVMGGLVENFAIYFAMKILTFQELVLQSLIGMCVEHQECGILMTKQVAVLVSVI